MHNSIPLLEFPCEFINVQPFNPLISKCQIKVCYVGESPNRNGSVITKEVATKMANSLPGSPIVGFFNENTGDFEEHNRIIDISNGKFEIKATTKPYGFVDLHAKCWFQKFSDDGIEHEYLCTEGWLWTGQFPEAKRVIEKGNNQSMELDDNTIDATWSRDVNGKPKFFIINEAIISKLCILGEDVEPCFEGAQITSVQFSFDEGFKTQLFAMMKELTELLDKGGTQVFTRYSVTVGDALWSALYSYVETSYPGEESGSSIYSIDGVYEENGSKFAVLQAKSDSKYYRLNFSFSEQDGFSAENELVELTDYSVADEPQFAASDVEQFEANYKAKKEEEEGKEGQNNKDKSKDKTEGQGKSSNEDPEGSEEDDDKKKKNFSKSKEEDDICPDCGKPLSECVCGSGGETKKKKDYNLEEVTEYTQLLQDYNDLKTKYAALEQEKAALEAQITPLAEFKNAAELKEKQEMIASFYMLSDEDKKDVVDNISKYSLDDIEAKLSILCVRNKVSFDLDENSKKKPLSYNLNGGDLGEDSSIPAWVRAAESVAKNMN